MRVSTWLALGLAGIVGVAALPVAVASEQVLRVSRWQGPVDITKQGYLPGSSTRLVPAMGQSVFVYYVRDPDGTQGRTLLAASTIVDGQVQRSAITGRGTAISDLRVPERGSQGGLMTAWLGQVPSWTSGSSVFYATAFYDGNEWGPTKVQVEQTKTETSSSSLKGFDVTQDAQGNAALIWRESVYDCTGDCTTVNGVYIRSFVEGAWQEPVRVLDSTLLPKGRFDITEPQITSLASGQLLACTDWTRQHQGAPEQRELRCWSSPGAGQPWSALPPIDAPEWPLSSQWSPLLLGDGEPALVHAARKVPAVSYFRGGSWSSFAAIAPEPEALTPDTAWAGSFHVADDGKGSAHVAMVWLDQVYGAEPTSSIHVASGDDKGWSRWHPLSPVARLKSNEENQLLGISAVPGAVLVTWTQGTFYDDFPGAELGLLSAWRVKGKWGSPVRVAPFDPVLDPRETSMRFQGGGAAVAESGKAAVTWETANEGNRWRAWTTQVPADVPGDRVTEPTSLSAAAQKGRVTLRWAPPNNASSTITAYQWRFQVKGGAWSPWRTVAKGAEARQQTVKRIRPRQVYVFQVRAMAGTTAGPAATTQVTGK